MPALPNTDRSDSSPTPAPGHSVFIVPRGEEQGFRANVRGHVLDLVDPSSYALAPTPDDLFVVSIAASLAWSAQTLLHALGLPVYVSVSAEWPKDEDPPHPGDIALKVTVSKRAETISAELTAAFEKRLAKRFLAKPVVRLAFEGVD
jgi:hypothetical protein